MTNYGYEKRTSFNSASTEMLKILVATSAPGSEVREKARAELLKRGVSE